MNVIPYVIKYATGSTQHDRLSFIQCTTFKKNPVANSNTLEQSIRMLHLDQITNV